MHKLNFILVVAAVTLCASEWVARPGYADDAPSVRQKALRPACRGPACGPYAPCGVRCRVVCPDGYSCQPLYGAYGPYGGVAYWGAYTFTGWGPVR